MKAMKLITILALISTFAVAQEIQQVSPEQAGKIARKVTEAMGSPSDAPFAVDADVEKATAIKGSGEVGLLAIPDKMLTVEKVRGAGKALFALGQMWMRNVVPAVGNAAPDAAKLRTVTVHERDQDAKVEVYFLGISKADAGDLELCLYAKDKEPLMKVPFVKTNAPESPVPIALDGRKEGENTGVLVVTVFGSYKADITVMKPLE